MDILFIQPSSRGQVYQSLGKELAAVEPPVWGALLAFCLVGLCIAVAMEAMHHANARARAEVAQRRVLEAAALTREQRVAEAARHREALYEFVDRLIKDMGLEGRRTHRPSELSGGQQQRVAIARALASKPAVVFADEPTGNLDSATSQEVLKLMRSAVDTLGQTIVMVTHDAHAAAVADRIVFLADGSVVRDQPAGTVDQILDELKVLQ